MRRALAVVVVLAVAVALAVAIALVAVAPSGAAQAKGPTLKSLQAQITSLQKQVKTLKKQEASDHNLAAAAVVYSACGDAVLADALQGTWMTVPNGSTMFGAQTPVNDYDACKSFNIVRANVQTPPTVATIQAVLDLIK